MVTTRTRRAIANTESKAHRVTRHINRATERELWARAAGRCQFRGCNRPLYKSPVTQELVNIAQMAHIYAFATAGPRGRGEFKKKTEGLNEVGNLMLVCHGCHRKIDKDKKGVRYSAGLLRGWKEAHETRIRIVTGITASHKSEVIFYHSRIGYERSPMHFDSAVQAMFPTWYPAHERPLDLSMRSEDDDSTTQYWQTESRNLQKSFDRQIRDRIEAGEAQHFSIFAFASQPLLIQLGTMFTDKIDTAVYQLHREPRTWQWQPHPESFTFKIAEPKDKSGTPVLAFALSAKIALDRISAVLKGKLSVWEMTVTEPNNDFLRSEAQLAMFRSAARKVLVDIHAAHASAEDLKIFPAMPLSCAVEFGRIRSPKADLPWTIFDQNNKHRRFIPALTIGKPNE
jgi:hypothetical protein